MFQAKYAEFARILLKYGVDVNAQNKNGLTPLRLADWHSKAGLRKLNASFSSMTDSGAHDNMNQIPFCRE
jgi:ankyrin repeat protein